MSERFDLEAFAADCGVADTAYFAERCGILHALLVAENEKTNLTRITEKEEFKIKHAADSLLLAKAFPSLTKKPISLADIGCGGGFPSLILALAFPNWKICAIDSTGKKTAFVRKAAQFLHLDNCEVVTGRSCELNRKAEFQERFDVVTARAVAKGKVIADDARRFPKKSGYFILYKTPLQAEEDLPELGAAWRLTSDFELPCGLGTRCFLTNGGAYV